jgi:ribose-phosphate pyrophosphokinase
MVSQSTLSLFALQSSRELGGAIANALGIALSPHEEREFDDGEHKARPLVSVRGQDVFVIESLYGDARRSVNDKLCRLLFFVGALVDAAARSVTVVAPYLCYARKDQKSQARDPITTRYVARLFEAVGTHRMVTVDVHNLAAYQNAFRCATEHLEANKLLVDYFARNLHGGEAVVVSPDAGAVKRAERFRQSLSRRLETPIASAFMEKQRAGGVLSGTALVGRVSGCTAVIIDDMISTGSTLVRCAEACRAQGALHVYAGATHGLFVHGANNKLLSSGALDRIIVTDTIPAPRLLGTDDKVIVLSIASLLAEAIRCIHEGGSIVELLQT